MNGIANRLKGWITIGGSPGEEGENQGGTHVFVDESGRISRGPTGLTGRHMDEVDRGKRKPGEKPKPPTSPKKPENRLRPDDERPLADRPPEHEPEDASDAGTSERTATRPGEVGEDLEGASERPGDQTVGRGREDATQPVGDEAAGDVPGGRVVADIDHVNRRLDRYEKHFRDRGQGQQADWMKLLRDHINEVGTKEALEQLGEERAASNRGRVVYEGEKAGWESMDDFTHAYLNRHGIVPVHETNEFADVSSLARTKFGSGGSEDGYTTGDLYMGRGATLHETRRSSFNKLEEAKNLPGLETSEDISVIMGKDVTHLTPEVTAKMDKRYGKGQWVIKVYGDDAYAGFGIFFPQKIQRLQKEAQDAIWSSGEELSRYNFSHVRDRSGAVTGIVHDGSGEVYPFGSRKYNTEIYGEVRIAADRAAAAAQNEKGPALLDRDGNVSGKEFMAQPAFQAVGISDDERARGVTGAEGGKGEGRVHVITRNGKAEVVPHSTWIKGDWLPVVFESEETKRMAQAAVDAINALPESEKQGQIYAPDVMPSAEGYRVVEANPSSEVGGSGYLGDNPFIIDSYVSYVLGREPAHTKFIRDLLSKKRGRKSSGYTVQVTKSGIVNRLKASFFETCDRDDKGRCVAGTGGGKKPTHHPGAAHGSKVKITKTEDRALGDDFKPVPIKTKLTKQETGRVAEAVCSAYLRDVAGFEDTVALNAGKANESIDLFGDSMAPEVKGGLCSNGKDAQKWRITFSMETASEKAAYAKMTEEQKTAYNRDKQTAALKRKLDLLEQLSRKLGRKIEPVTITTVINPDTQTADVYKIPGYHPIIRWRDAAQYRVASVRYDHE